MKNFLFLAISLFLFYSCGNDDCDNIQDYLFEIPTTLIPIKDTFQIGDTLKFTSKFSTEVFDRNNQRSYNLDDFKFYPFFYFNRVDTTFPDGLFTEETLIMEEGFQKGLTFHSDGATSLTTQYKLIGNQYLLEFQMILHKPGLSFFYGSSDLDDSFVPEQDFPGKCKNKRVDIYLKLKSEVDNNYKFLLSAQEPFARSLIENDIKYKQLGGYCFYVVE